jgi:hypothetical protein
MLGTRDRCNLLNTFAAVIFLHVSIKKGIMIRASKAGLKTKRFRHNPPLLLSSSERETVGIAPSSGASASEVTF